MEEKWVPIIGFESLYEVSNLGRVRRKTTIKKFFGRVHKANGFLSPGSSQGYKHVVLYKDGSYTTLRIHRLVAAAFHPNPENKSEVNHIDGIRNNNRADNLEWCTRLENVHHAIHVLKKVGGTRKKQI